MNEEQYSNREIREMFKDVQSSLNRIESQTTRTNGRVNKLENWRSYMAGAIGVIVIIFPIVIKLLNEK